MTEFSLAPAFVVINYRSFKGLHKQTIPVNNWLDTPNVGGSGAFPQWDAGTIDADTMIDGLVTLMRPVLPTTTTILDYVIYTKADDDAIPTPVAQGPIASAGTSVLDPVAAAQATYVFRTADFHLFKFILLDIAPPDDFQSLTFADLSADNIALVNYLRSMDNAWAGRDGSRPSQLIRLNYTLNDKLQAAYRRR